MIIDDHSWHPGYMPDQLVSTETAALEIGVAYRTLLRWARTGKVQPAMYTPGGQYRWNLSDLQRQLATQPGASGTK